MIIPTLGVSDGMKNYDRMIKGFLDKDIRLLRINMSRYNPEKYEEDVEYIRAISSGKIEIMADIPIPGQKYRLYTNENRIIEKDQEVIFVPLGNPIENAIVVDIEKFVDKKEAGKILLGDGEISFTTKFTSEDKIVAVADNAGMIRGKRAFVFLDNIEFSLYKYDELERYLKTLKKIDPLKIVLSFSEKKEILIPLDKKIKQCLPKVKIVPKIETQIGINNLEEIADYYDEIMLGRGDLGLYSDINSFGQNQEYVLNISSKKGINAIVATDILTSLYDSIIPARGELTDIYYLKNKNVKDIVVASGISMNEELFNRFYLLTQKEFGL